MKTFNRLLLICAFCALSYSCDSGSGGSGTDNPTSDTVDNLGFGDIASNQSFAFANNSALLSGPTFGSNKSANVELRKGVPFELVGGLSDIVAERVVIVREEGDTSLPFVVAYIRNNSDSVRCGILFDDIEVVHEDGEAFQVVNHFFSSGSVNNNSENDNRTVQNCLPAGGTGYHVIAGSGQGLYDKVAKVRFSLGSNFNISSGVNELPGTVLPVSYDVIETARDGLITLAVSVQNNLAKTVRIAPPNVFALDEKGQPIMYSAAGLDNTIEAFTIASGETKSVTILMYLSGQASTIRASVFFTYPQ